MKTIIAHTTCVSLAVLLLFSTMSFTVGVHYCGNIMVDKAILSQAEPCEMHNNSSNEEESQCCDDEVEVIKGQNTLQIVKAEFDIDIPLELAIFSFIHFSSPQLQAWQVTTTEIYDPPEYDLDLQTLHQVFLI